DARNSPSIRPNTCAGPLHSILPITDMAEPMQESGPVVGVRTGLGAACSTTERSACSMTSAALAATLLSCSAALPLKLFNISTSLTSSTTVRREADIPIIGPVFVMHQGYHSGGPADRRE